MAKHLSSIPLSVGWWIVFAQIPFGCLGLRKLGLQMMGGKTCLRPICISRCTTQAFEHTICHRFSDHLGLHFVKIHIVLEKNRQSVAQNINMYILPLCKNENYYCIYPVLSYSILFILSDYQLCAKHATAAYSASLDSFIGHFHSTFFIILHSYHDSKGWKRKPGKTKGTVGGKVPPKTKRLLSCKSCRCWWWQG